jgi:hypothetical protein
MATMQMPVHEPDVRVIREGVYRLKRDESAYWIHKGVLHRITVHAGFEFDGASIPSVARPFFGGIWSLGLWPPLLHDWKYYWHGRLPYKSHCIHVRGVWVDALTVLAEDGSVERRLHWSRHDSDRFFGAQMRLHNVSRWRRRAAYRAVRAAFWKAWD